MDAIAEPFLISACVMNGLEHGSDILRGNSSLDVVHLAEDKASARIENIQPDVDQDRNRKNQPKNYSAISLIAVVNS